jgi:predicted nucleic acid-binding protein
MKVYLDSCSTHRPLDSKNQIRILLEADAVLGIISLCDAGQIDLVSSETLLYEARRNPNPVRKQHALAVLEKANIVITIDDIIEQRARLFVEAGIKPLNALHLASAEAAEVEYFCTCDDQFLRKAQVCEVSNCGTDQ